MVFACLQLSLAPDSYHRVQFVYDGDTLLLENGARVRYLGIDAPEMDHENGNHEFMAERSWQFNKSLVQHQLVKVVQGLEKKDPYDRILGYIFLKDGRMVNDVIVRNGMAHVMIKSEKIKYAGMLLESQRKAMQQKVGIWSRDFKKKEPFYIGNRRSLRFHRPDCPFGKKISPPNLIRFKTRRHAFWQGYSPCRKCSP